MQAVSLSLFLIVIATFFSKAWLPDFKTDTQIANIAKINVKKKNKGEIILADVKLYLRMQ